MNSAYSMKEHRVESGVEGPLHWTVISARCGRHREAEKPLVLVDEHVTPEKREGLNKE